MAHKLTKPKVGESPTFIEGEHGPSSAPQDHVQHHRDVWARYWGSRDMKGPGLCWEEVEASPKLNPERLRKTASTFGVNTSAADGWHPRMFSELSDEALQGLSDIYHMIELVGNFPSDHQTLLVRLIPKPNSLESRPIGLYKGLFRLWAKRRTDALRSWSREHPEAAKFINTLPGRQTLDGVWRAQLQGYLDQSEGLEAAEVMWDVRTCYEHVSHAKLADQARAQNYPLQLLRVSIASYGWERQVIGDLNIMAAPVLPGAGIVAGSSMATFEIAMYMQAELGSTVKKHDIGLSVHIDDLSISATAGNGRDLAKLIVPALVDVKAALGFLDLPVAPPSRWCFARPRKELEPSRPP